MVREIITINVGRCGIQMGHHLWKQYCAEANITRDGKQVDSLSTDDTFKTFFRETTDGEYRARTLMVDSERSVVENVRKCAYSNIYDDDFLLLGNESANNNFAKGRYRVASQMMDQFNDQLRKLAENCDDFQGLFITHSVGGGTGSGLGSRILERIHLDFQNKTKVCP